MPAHPASVRNHASRHRSVARLSPGSGARDLRPTPNSKGGHTAHSNGHIKANDGAQAPIRQEFTERGIAHAARRTSN